MASTYDFSGVEQLNIREIVRLAPLIPVLSVADIAHAVPLARA